MCRHGLGTEPNGEEDGENGGVTLPNPAVLERRWPLWEGRRSNWGLHPETCDALLSTKDVRIIGTHGHPSELMGLLPPFAPADARRSSDSEQGYSFSDEEAAALTERVNAMSRPSVKVTA